MVVHRPPTLIVHTVPPAISAYCRADLLAQRADWLPTPFWRNALAGHRTLFDDLVMEVSSHAGIRRAFVHERATGNPVDLFLAAMAWGYGRSEPRFPAMRQMLVGTKAVALTKPADIAAIVLQTQTVGAAAGWSALFGANKVAGLNLSFGTKLLYFAGYSVSSPGPRPLILDDNVRKALARLAPGTVAPVGRQVRSVQYLAYLNLAAQWASDPTWNETPEVAEYALFMHR